MPEIIVIHTLGESFVEWGDLNIIGKTLSLIAGTINEMSGTVTGVKKSGTTVYAWMLKRKLHTPTTDKQTGITTSNTRIGGESSDSPKSDKSDFANSQDVSHNSSFTRGSSP